MSQLDLVAFERVLAHTKLRVRGGRSARGLLVGSVLSASTLIVLRALSGRLPGASGWLVLSLSAFLPALVGALWPVASESAARLLDQSQDGHGRARAGVEFSRLPANQRTPFMQAHLRDLAARASTWSARRAVPLRRPRELALLLVPPALWLLTLVSHPTAHPSRSASLTVEKQPAISQDDLLAFRRELRELEATQTGPLQAKEEMRAFNKLLESLATGELSRAEGIRALLSLERKLLEGAPITTDADRESLRELADDLARASQAMAKALRDGDGDKAAKELRALTRRAAQKDDLERERLKQALAQERARKRDEDARQAREKELEGLLRKPPAATAEAGERSLFERRRRELERLRREHADRGSRSRQLERLSRDLASAADALDRNAPSEAERALEEAARDLERFAEQNRAQDASRELAREASQLRELLQRKSGQQEGQPQPQANTGGRPSEQEARQQRFVLKARGEGEEKQVSLRPGQQGERANQGQGEQEQGEQGQGEQEQKQGQHATALTPAEGAGESSEQVDLLLPTTSSRTRIVQQPGSERGAPPLESPTSLKANHTDSAVAGMHGQGPTRSQVILDAADRGFRTTSYQKVYADYRAHAESVIERDQVPPGHRFYVRRYFQLIRPRDE